MYDRKKLEHLRQSLEKWEEAGLQKTLASMPERQKQFITTSSESVNRLYTPLDVPGLDYEKDLGLPGEYPYTRGVHPTLHRGKLWTMRMFAGFGTPPSFGGESAQDARPTAVGVFKAVGMQAGKKIGDG